MIESDDDLALQKFSESIRIEGGRYQIEWPWKYAYQITTPCYEKNEIIS